MTKHEQYDPVRRYPPNQFLNMVSGGASFPLLELILDPTHTQLRLQDAILISLDLESRVVEPLGVRQVTQIGIASLDTRILKAIDINDQGSLVAAVESRVFNVYPKRDSAKAWLPKSLWSVPEKIDHDQICNKLNEIFLRPGCGFSEEPQRIRDVILIGHSIHSDRSLLLKLFDFDIKRVTSIIAILDTGRMICNAYDFGIATHSHFPLRLTLRYLGIPYAQLHDAGNDAMFTMKALLLMFSNWKYQKGKHLWNIAEGIVFDATPTNVTGEVLWDVRLEVLTAVARESWPVSKRPPIREPRKHSELVTEQIDLLSINELDLTKLFG